MINCLPIISSSAIQICNYVFHFVINLSVRVASFLLLNKMEDCASGESLFKYRFHFVNTKTCNSDLKEYKFSCAKSFSDIFNFKSIPDRVFIFPLSHLLPDRQKKPYSQNIFLIALACCIFCAGCVKEKIPHSISENTSAAKASIQILTNGNLDIKNTQEVTNTLYIEVVDSQGKPIQLPGEITKEATRQHFIIVNTPKDAAYILHIDILQEGPASLPVLSRLVNSGFGSRARLSGSGRIALLADALLVKRRVPEERQEKTTNLVNISARNTLESAKMRIGILAAGDSQDTAKIHDELADCLAQELKNAL